MLPPELRVPVEAIRREAAMARDAASLRSVAREVGLSPMGLHNFIRGRGQLQARTVRKLNSWYAARMARHLPEGEDEARAALTILAGYFSERARPIRALQLLEVMEQGFRDEGAQVPAWVDSIRREVQADPEWLHPPPQG
jgi:hypothetical protein